MLRVLCILILGLVLEAVGVVYLSKGIKQVGEPDSLSVGEIGRLVGRGVRNPNVLLGVALEAAFFGCLLVLLGRADVSVVWPLTALGFVLTTIAAKVILHEVIPPARWGGVLLIVLGAALISATEKPKPTAKAGPQTPASATPR